MTAQARGSTVTQWQSTTGTSGSLHSPPDLDDDATRSIFRQLRTLRDDLQQQLGIAMPTLSMGMSSDFELAIAEGATHVRIGTAIFGAR